MPTAFSYRLDTLRQLAPGLVDQAYLTELNELQEKLRSGRPNLLVVGLFKRGKSSLVNALLGADLAPVGVTPLTAIVTSFEHDPERSFARVYFRAGRSLETDAREIGPYVSEEDNPNNNKGVSFVRLFDPTLSILKTITLIDTPGLGSAHVHNTAETVAFVPRIDAALFVLSADLPVSEADIEFLKDLKKNVPVILFALNKKDLLRESDLQKLMAHNRQMIISKAGFLPEEVDIIPVSSHLHQQGLIAAGNMDALTAALFSVVRKDDNALLLHSLERGIDRLSDRLAFLLKARIEAIHLPIAELELRKQRLLQIPALLSSRKEDFNQLLTGQTSRLTTFVQQTVQSKANELNKSLPEKLAALAQPSPADIAGQVQGLNQWILGAFEQVHSDLENETRLRFQESLSQYARQPEGFLAELISQLSEIIQMDFSVIVDKFDLDVYAPFYLSLDGGSIAGNNGAFIKRLLPASIRQRLLLQQLSTHYQEIIVRNAAAVIYNLDYRIQESQRKFSGELQRRLHDIVNQIQTLLSDTIRLHADYASGIDQSSNELKEKLNRLLQLKTPNKPIHAPENSKPTT